VFKHITHCGKGHSCRKKMLGGLLTSVSRPTAGAAAKAIAVDPSKASFGAARLDSAAQALDIESRSTISLNSIPSSALSSSVPSTTSSDDSRASSSPPSEASASSGSPVLAFEVGTSTLKGQFHPNEDRLAVYSAPSALEDSSSSQGGVVVLVADGHDGSTCAEFVSKTAFMPAFEAALARRPGRGQEGEALSLKEAFSTCEALWESRVEQLKAANVTTGVTSGSCLTAAVLKADGQVLTANVGDCRAVLRRSDGSLEILSTDHRCSDPIERERILRLGGVIKNNRVMGLEPTRTLGDIMEKRATKPGVITCEPDVYGTNINGATPSGAAAPASDEEVLATITGMLEAAGQTQALSLIPASLGGEGGHGGGASGRSTGTSSHHRSQSAAGQGRGGAGDGGGTTNVAAARASRNAALAGHGHGSSSHYYGSSAASNATNLHGGRSSSASLSGVRKLGSGAALTPGMALARTMLAVSNDPRSSLSLSAGGAGTGASARGVRGLSAVAATFPSSVVKPVPSFSLADAAATAPSLPFSFFVVATDGVWDVISPPSACAIICHALAVFGDANAAARELTLFAKRYGSTDDISAIVVWIKCSSKKDHSSTSSSHSSSSALSAAIAASTTSSAATGASARPSPYLSYSAAAGTSAGAATSGNATMALE
jgi:serine/threonine protein phosphatase PrpC